MGATILVVDDDEELRQMLCTMLRLMGYETFAARDGCDALKQIANQMPDVLVLDVMMPKMDGITLCHRLRQQAETTELPILMLSGKSQPEDMEAGLKAGADRYLSKPMAMDVLMRNLAELLAAPPASL